MSNSYLQMNNPNTRYILDSFDISPSDSEEVKTRKTRVETKVRETLSEKLNLQETASVDITETNENGTPRRIAVADASLLTSQQESRRDNNGY